jgi:hypothetical protein
MSESVIEGAWALRSYVVAGAPRPVEGWLLFADGSWATVYFSDVETASPWGSGEAGSYEQTGTALTFVHRVTIQGSATRPLKLEPRGSLVEHCTIDLTPGTLDIHFPSGNTVRLERAPRA